MTMSRTKKEIGEELDKLEKDAYKIWSVNRNDPSLLSVPDKHQELRDELNSFHHTFSQVMDFMETEELLSRSKIAPNSTAHAKFEHLKYKGGALTREAI